jgi:tetratricopeptide (TPR) repeat protein
MFQKFVKVIGKLSFLGVLAVLFALNSGAGRAVPDASTQEQKDDGAEQPDNEDAAKGDEKAPPVAKAKRDDSSASFSSYLSGRFAESQGDTEHGVQVLRESLKRDPDNQDLLKSLYRMLVLSGNVEEAVPLARKLEGVKVVDDGSEFTPEMLIAIDEAKQHRYERSDKYLAAIPKAGFNSLLVPQMRVWLKLAMGQLKAPADVKNMMPDAHVVLPHVYLNAALINDIAGFDKEALKQYESAIKDSRIEPFRAVEALANFYDRKGQKDKRAKLVSDYLSEHGDSYLADELLTPSESPPQPLVSDAGQGLAEVFYAVANIFHGVRAPADEIATLHLALYLRPDFPAAQFLLASAYELAQNYQAAADTYKVINVHSPYFVRGRIRGVYDEIELGKKDAALAELDTIIHENPKDIDALLAKGDILRAENKLKEAIGAYDAAIARVPNPGKRHWIIYFSRGACYQLISDWNKAEADMKKALALDPGEPEVLNYLGYSWLTMRQNIAEAKKMVEDAYGARPEDAHIIDSMGYAFYVTGDFAGAEEYFDQALDRTPNDPTVNDHLGDTYWQLGRKTEARYQWERALSDKPDDETEKGLRKKLKEGLAVERPQQSAEEKKPAKPSAPADE